MNALLFQPQCCLYPALKLFSFSSMGSTWITEKVREHTLPDVSLK